MRIGCPPHQPLTLTLPRPHLLQALQHSPRGHIQDVYSGATDTEEVLPSLIQLVTKESQSR